MRPPSPTAALEEMPNVGPAVARDLLQLGIRRPADLRGRDPVALYKALCRKTGRRQDPCVLDVFFAVVDCARSGCGKPWWAFTKKRKALVAANPDLMVWRKP